MRARVRRVRSTSMCNFASLFRILVGVPVILPFAHAIAQTSPTPAQASTSSASSVSPDKKWEFVAGDERKLLKADTKEVVLKSFANWRDSQTDPLPSFRLYCRARRCHRKFSCHIPTLVVKTFLMLPRPWELLGISLPATFATPPASAAQSDDSIIGLAASAAVLCQRVSDICPPANVVVA